MKACSKCGVSKPLSEFHKDSKTKCGLNYRCKPCAIEDARASLERHPETRARRSAAQSAAWGAAKCDRHSAQGYSLGVGGTAATQEERLLRLPEVLKLIPVSRTSWWRGVKDGRFPSPIKLGMRTTCWRASDIDSLLKSL